MGAARTLPELDEVGAEFFDDCAIVRCCFGVDDVEDALLRDYKAVSETLAFGCIDAGFVIGVQPWGVLAFIVAGKVADDERIGSFVNYLGCAIVGFVFL